jgi:L-2,4-diaminobutyric acid acetyltransferase
MKATSVLIKQIVPPIAAENIVLDQPGPLDGAAVNRLVSQCVPLDTNSVYCNLLQCTHFSQTSIKAELNDQIVGFVSGYIPPAKTDTLFVWQVAVSNRARGYGLGKRMLLNLLQRSSEESGVKYLETTITPDNKASWALFTRVATSLQADLSSQTLFERQAHFAGKHDDEVLLQIGPFDVGTIQEVVQSDCA